MKTFDKFNLYKPFKILKIPDVYTDYYQPPFSKDLFFCQLIAFYYLAVLLFPTLYWLIFKDPIESRHKVFGMGHSVI